MTFPTIPESRRVARLEPPARKVRMVLDTDTFNEIDDQFAVVYSLLSPTSMKVEAIYAAPFFPHPRSTSPEQGMQASYEEILRLLQFLNVDADGFAFRGSEGFVSRNDRGPLESAAARDLIERALNSPDDDPLYVVAIGAPTNVASAILIEPAIIEHIVVVWLAGNPAYWLHNREFNMSQDLHASRIIMDCGVPLTIVPLPGVTTHLRTTVPEIERYVEGQGALGDYLAKIFKDYREDHMAWSKEIWDVAAIAYLVNHEWTPSYLTHSPIITQSLNPEDSDHRFGFTSRWSHDSTRHLIRAAYYINRDPIFRDLFEKLAAWSRGSIKIDR